MTEYFRDDIHHKVIEHIVSDMYDNESLQDLEPGSPKRTDIGSNANHTKKFSRRKSISDENELGVTFPKAYSMELAEAERVVEEDIVSKEYEKENSQDLEPGYPKSTDIDSNANVRKRISRRKSISDENELGVTLPKAYSMELAEAEKEEFQNLLPQSAPGASAAVGHNIANSIPLSIFPIQPDKLCICFCGLPGRGKTHISRRLARYLSFFHALPTKVFNVCEYRRTLYTGWKDADWFDPNNSETHNLRNHCHSALLKDMREYLSSHSNAIVIMDGTNATHERRREVFNQMKIARAKLIFVEVTNDSADFLSNQYKNIVKTCPDYAGISHSEAELDYARRVEHYRLHFESLDDTHEVESRWCFFRCDHSRKNFSLHNVHGYLPLKVVNFIMNMRTGIHSFYMTRHGQSEYNQLGRIGGDSGLSEHGLAYAHKLAEYVEEKITKDENGDPIASRLWTSSMKRTKETAQFIKRYKVIIRDEYGDDYEWEQMKPHAWFHLDELFAGACDGMTYEEIAQQFPEEWDRRKTDKLAYRYPRGESYLDVIARLEPMITEIERRCEPVVIVAHQGILRIIYAFYKGLTRSEAPHVSIPLNTIIKLTPTPYDCLEERTVLYQMSTVSDGQDEPPSH